MSVKSLIVITLLVLCACATAPSVPPLSVDEALAMIKSGDSADSVIQRMRASHSSYRLSASDVLRLHDSGMPAAVLDYMLQTQLDDIRGEQHARDVELTPPTFYWGWRRW